MIRQPGISATSVSSPTVSSGCSAYGRVRSEAASTSKPAVTRLPSVPYTATDQCAG
ncbi:hypothetical protein [Kitasatospora setae]|uniref:hypothetical protein n=1 Tax=Kitasatospora setae TaxID=2066 RepID=UPI0014704895|nr:hypothetical protein [Kitasatospora setae]